MSSSLGSHSGHAVKMTAESPFHFSLGTGRGQHRRHLGTDGSAGFLLSLGTGTPPPLSWVFPLPPPPNTVSGHSLVSFFFFFFSLCPLHSVPVLSMTS